jgi:hypothetical protein
MISAIGVKDVEILPDKHSKKAVIATDSSARGPLLPFFYFQPKAQNSNRVLLFAPQAAGFCKHSVRLPSKA